MAISTKNRIKNIDRQSISSIKIGSPIHNCHITAQRRGVEQCGARRSFAKRVQTPSRRIKYALARSRVYRCRIDPDPLLRYNVEPVYILSIFRFFASQRLVQRDFCPRAARLLYFFSTLVSLSSRSIEPGKFRVMPKFAVFDVSGGAYILEVLTGTSEKWGR